MGWGERPTVAHGGRLVPTERGGYDAAPDGRSGPAGAVVGRGGVAQNCAVSVDSSIAVVELVPPDTALLTASK